VVQARCNVNDKTVLLGELGEEGGEVDGVARAAGAEGFGAVFVCDG